MNKNSQILVLYHKAPEANENNAKSESMWRALVRYMYEQIDLQEHAAQMSVPDDEYSVDTSGPSVCRSE